MALMLPKLPMFCDQLTWNIKNQTKRPPQNHETHSNPLTIKMHKKQKNGKHMAKISLPKQPQMIPDAVVKLPWVNWLQ
jgi:hypothetical protein